MTRPPSEPGWFPDPSGQGQRYWDGSKWGPTAPTNPALAPAKKKRRWPWVLAAFVLFVIIVGSVNGKNDKTITTSPLTSPLTSSPLGAPSDAPSGAAPSTTTTAEVTYQIESDGSLSTVTYFDALNNEKQVTDVSSPWTMTFANQATYPIYGLGAQTTWEHVSCQISVNGQVRDQKSAAGRFAVVNCNAAANG